MIQRDGRVKDIDDELRGSAAFEGDVVAALQQRVDPHPPVLTRCFRRHPERATDRAGTAGSLFARPGPCELRPFRDGPCTRLGADRYGKCGSSASLPARAARRCIRPRGAAPVPQLAPVGANVSSRGRAECEWRPSWQPDADINSALATANEGPRGGQERPTEELSGWPTSRVIRSASGADNPPWVFPHGGMTSHNAATHSPALSASRWQSPRPQLTTNRSDECVPTRSRCETGRPLPDPQRARRPVSAGQQQDDPGLITAHLR